MQNQNDYDTLKKSIDEKSPVSIMVSLINNILNPIKFLVTKSKTSWWTTQEGPRIKDGSSILD